MTIIMQTFDCMPKKNAEHHYRRLVIAMPGRLQIQTRLF
jgi:hypothetical protein